MEGQKSKDRNSGNSFIRNRPTHASIENRLLNEYDIPENLGNFIVELLCKRNTEKTSVMILTFGHNLSEIVFVVNINNFRKVSVMQLDVI